MKYLKVTIPILALIGSIGSGGNAIAQNFTSSGNDWGAGWGFQSATDRSLGIQQAQAIRSAVTQPGPSTVVSNSTYNSADNRSGYVDASGLGASYGQLDIHLNGDKIGQNTNAIGAMNTGTTNIDVNGNNNWVDATNAADSSGCIDGSVALTETPFASMETASGIDIAMDLSHQKTRCAP
ncbi:MULTISPECIES: hypothetical protein [unclassified Yoonia]|uniref:hypothetical protein n=1 Tax=unclassified Yoonia TaxID=2629118 RepID=UPI002B0003DF|nr:MULTISPECIES: hypothetical protein [unclassified Yoonia]